MKLRDKLWIFGVRAHQDDAYLGHSSPLSRFGSSMTPAEAAFYLNVPNMIMVTCQGDPIPFSQRAEQYMLSYTPCSRVLWSVDSSFSEKPGEGADYVLDLSRRYPNLTGAFSDDFIGRFRRFEGEEKLRKAAEYIRTVRETLDRADRHLDLYVVYYTHEIDEAHREIFRMADGLTNWTWNCQDLPKLEENLEKLHDFMPDKKLLNGVYLFDFPSRKPVPADLMEFQCETSRRLMHEGRLDGMIFECNATMGVGSPNDPWLREWIRVHGDEEVPD